jgi:hypothetical protein
VNSAQRCIHVASKRRSAAAPPRSVVSTCGSAGPAELRAVLGGDLFTASTAADLVHLLLHPLPKGPDPTDAPEHFICYLRMPGCWNYSSVKLCRKHVGDHGTERLPLPSLILKRASASQPLQRLRSMTTSKARMPMGLWCRM